MKNDLIRWTWLKKESLLEDMTTETSKIEKQRAKDWKNRIEYLRNVKQLQKVFIMGILERKAREKGTQAILSNEDREFS